MADAPEGGPSPGILGMPRWVMVFLAIAVALVLGLVVTRFAGVEHGPGLHTPQPDGHAPPAQNGP